MRIASRPIGPGHPCFVIAEAGVNHNGDLTLAHRLIDAAAQAGADAVKFQTFRADRLVTAGTVKAVYQTETTGGDEGQQGMLSRLELSSEAHASLIGHAAERGILFLSTPYDPESLDLLVQLAVPALKIASTDVTNPPFLRQADSSGVPVILSTGMAGQEDVDMAVASLKNSSSEGRLAILQCTSQYPAPLDEVNLKVMMRYHARYGCPVGFSDHSQGLDACSWAVAAGAMLVEKHITLDRTLPGPDHRASIEPDELSRLTATIRAVERALGDGVKRIMPSEAANRAVMQKSLVARADIAAGERFTAALLACKRPASGLPPSAWERVVGRRAARTILADQPLHADDVEWEDD